MKLLLTGSPGIGKSTVLKKVAADLKISKYGIVAKEIKNDQSQRMGFEAVALNGNSRVFAHKSLFKTELTVGKYYVDIKAIDDFVVPELKKGLNKNKTIVFIDEIGRMQSFSKEFLNTVKDLFSGKSNLLATIVFEDEPWSLEFKKHPNAIMIEVNIKNREYLPEILETVFSNAEEYNKLSLQQQRSVDKELRDLIAQNKFIQAKKLFNNAIVYIAEERIKKVNENSKLIEYSIRGKTNEHKPYFIR